MKTIRIEDTNFAEIAKEVREESGGLSACLGTFNGVHMAHQMLLRDARVDALYKFAVISFSSPLGEFGIKNKSKEQLLTDVQKEVQFKKLAVKYDIEIKPTKELLALSAEDFINQYLLPFGVKEVFVGQDFRFGNNREGDIELLKKYFKVHVNNIYTYEGDKISTSKIIKEINNGNIKFANYLLGHPFEIHGVVEHGAGNGKSIGYPTINIRPFTNYPLPKYGVYEVMCYLSGIPYKGIANVGVHPTIDKLEKPVVEVHLLNYHGDAYGKNVYVEFLAWIREEKHFNSVEELKAQIAHDVSLVKK